MKIRRLRTTSEVIDVLGGTVKAAGIMKRKPQHITNYRSTGRFPPDTYLIVIAELGKRNCTASPSLWGIAEPRRAAAG